MKMPQPAVLVSYLVGHPGTARSAALTAYHETFDTSSRMANSTFRKRKVWWQPNDAEYRTLFFPSCITTVHVWC